MGSFDPVHKGHQEFVKMIIKIHYVDTVIIVPAFQNVFKEESMPLSTRIDMLRLAFQNEIKNGTVIIDGIEGDIATETGLKKIPSWMALNELKRKYGDFIVLTTVETFNSMPSWLCADQLKNYDYHIFELGDYDKPLNEKAVEMFKSFHVELPMFLLNEGLHSTHIRKGSDSFRKKNLHPDVYTYIKNHNMYVVPRNWCYTIKDGEHAGTTLYSGRFTCVSGKIFCDEFDGTEKKQYVLANKRGPGCPDYVGCWTLPCGYIEANENAQEAISRETFEECGIRIDPKLFEFETVETEPALCNNGNITLRYRVVLKNREGLIYEKPSGEENEVEEVRWIPLDEVNNYEWAFNHRKILIDEYYTNSGAEIL